MHECPVSCDAPTFLCRYLLACFHLPLSTTLVLHVILYSVHICIYYVEFNISHVPFFFRSFKLWFFYHMFLQKSRIKV